MPVLRKVAEDITPEYPELDTLIENMWETLANSEGIGLAAPQIGRAIRLVIIDLDPLAEDMPEYKDFRHVYINPHIIEYDEKASKETSQEGCLSLPAIHENVTRPTRIHVEYDDENFTHHDEWIDGYLARVMQHEFDHLDGKMFIDRISPFRKQLIKSKLKALLQGRFSCGYKTNHREYKLTQREKRNTKAHCRQQREMQGKTASLMCYCIYLRCYASGNTMPSTIQY